MTYKIIPLPKQATDITGFSYGKLTAIYPVKSTIKPAAKKSLMWFCVCECGRKSVVRGSHLRMGKINSCGCSKGMYISEKKTKHGLCHTAEYRSWSMMKNRVFNKKNPAYKNYGGRGISMCDEWIESFERFYADMGNKPSPDHSIDRINNDGDYCPENCKWSTSIEQSRNTRRNVFIEVNGESRCVSAWAQKMGVPKRLIYGRLKAGWSAYSAVTKQVSHSKLTTIQAKIIKAKHPSVTQKQLATAFKVNASTVADILAGRTWRHVPFPCDEPPMI